MLQRRVFTNSRLLRSVTGFSRPEFNLLLLSFTAAYLEANRRQPTDPPRRRRPGGGRTGQLPTMADKLLFILVYVHVYPTQEVQGVLFDFGQSQASAWVLRLLPILKSALGKEVVLPARTPADMEMLCRQFPETRFLLDATERPIPRPGNQERQKQYYSGKKKRHTLKNSILTGQRGRRIYFLGATVQGNIHDKKQADADSPAYPPGAWSMADSGYQGYCPPGVHVVVPIKKPRGGDLSDEDKAVNTALAKLRVFVEHAIRGIKRQRIAAETLRNTSEGFGDLVIEVAGGLYNLTNRFRGYLTPVAA